jgi:hypothetical protein
MPQSDSSLRRATEHVGNCGTLGGWQRIRRRTPFFPRLVRGVRPRVSLFVRSHDLDPRAATGQTQSSTRVHAIAAPHEGQGCQRIGLRISSNEYAIGSHGNRRELRLLDGASASRELILWELEFMERPIGIEPTPEPCQICRKMKGNGSCLQLRSLPEAGCGSLLD